jgi:hypothetical protein
MKAILGLVSGFVTTLNTRGDKSPAEMGRAKRGGLRGIRRVLMERRRHIAVLAIILYFFITIPLWMQPPVKTHLFLLLSGLRYGEEVSDCGCQQTGSLPSETEMRALVRSAIQKEQGGDAK